jgi:hypothetical protein
VATAEKRHEVRASGKDRGVQMHVLFSSAFRRDEELLRPTELFLRKLFMRFGSIVDVAVKEYVVYAEQQVQEGYGFVSFDSPDSLLAAVQACSALLVQGLAIKCTVTHVQKDDPFASHSLRSGMHAVMNNMNMNAGMNSSMSSSRPFSLQTQHCDWSAQVLSRSPGGSHLSSSSSVSPTSSSVSAAAFQQQLQPLSMPPPSSASVSSSSSMLSMSSSSSMMLMGSGSGKAVSSLLDGSAASLERERDAQGLSPLQLHRVLGSGSVGNTHSSSCGSGALGEGDFSSVSSLLW